MGTTEADLEDFEVRVTQRLRVRARDEDDAADTASCVFARAAAGASDVVRFDDGTEAELLDERIAMLGAGAPTEDELDAEPCPACGADKGEPCSSGCDERREAVS